MKSYQLLPIILLSASSLTGQGISDKIIKELTSITTIDQARQYLNEQTKLAGDLYSYNSSDSSQMSKDILASEIGEILEYESTDQKIKYIIKILEKEDAQLYRVQYIFLDNKIISINQIDSLRNVIFKRLSAGESFDNLAKEYSMDGNSTNGGDMGWFEDGMLVKEFEDAVKNNAYGQVYKVDVENEKWYYVVKNSHKPKTDKKAIVLYIEVKNDI